MRWDDSGWLDYCRVSDNLLTVDLIKVGNSEYKLSLDDDHKSFR